LIAGISQAATGALAAPGKASQARALCSLATLRGTYQYAADGVRVGGATAGPFALAGQSTFDGRGGVSGVFSASFGGTIVRGGAFTGTYTVNPDCTGTETGAGGGMTIHFDNFIRPDGRLVASVQTDPGSVSSTVLTRASGPTSDGH
jgi:hypothetical protein